MEQLAEFVWLVPLFPLLGFLTLIVVGRRIGEPGAGWIATLAMGGSFAASVMTFVGLLARDHEDRIVEVRLFDWVAAGDLHVNMGFIADPLSVTMILFITGVATLIHLYSIGYMHGDENFSKFFIYLNMFAFSMLLLVLGDNLLLTFLGWEGVGACSYFLISFWFKEEANSSAGKKAFVTNRVGDFGFMLATFLAFFTFGSINYGEMFSGAGSMGTGTATAIALLLFVGAAGKSAQFPLYLWLPDAMAGPTPVSALIHAATMVTSGIYLLTRMNPIIAEAHTWVPDIIAWVGLFTALFAASIAVAQNDIKKVLAYSTVSQLGFMFVAVGSGLYVAAIFHMITHAFFKALLFLGSGSVIHGMDNDQDMRNYGGLRKLMPITSMTFIIGWLAISGVPPFSGFWSKDEVLLGAWHTNRIMWFLLLIAAIMTAFYMTRLVIMTFFGERRWTSEDHGSDTHGGGAVHADTTSAVADLPEPIAVAGAAGADELVAAADGDTLTEEQVIGDALEAPVQLPHRHPHESPWQMTLPLIALAGAAAVAGFMNLPFASETKFLEHWLEPILFGNENHLDGVTGPTKWVLAIIAIIGGLIGLASAAAVYLRSRINPASIEKPILGKAWGYDTAVTAFMGGPGRKLFDGITAFDRTVVDGAVNGVASLVRGLAMRVRGLQSGFVRSYALSIGGGAVALLIYFLTRAL